MLTVLCTCAVLLLSMGASASDTKADENPIRKITGMLDDMRKELEHEAENESELFDKAMCLCETGEKELQGVVDHSGSEITRLTSKIDSDSANKDKLDKELVIHKKDKVDTEASLKEAAAIREKDAAKFAEQEKMNKFSISQLDEAIPLFAKGGASFAQSGSKSGENLKKIMQVSRYLDPNKRGAILNFLDGAMTVAKEPSSAAQEIIGMMKAMRDEMATDLQDMQKLEQGEANGFAEMKESKERHLGTLMSTISDKQKRTGSLALSLSEDQDSLEDANVELADAQKYLATLQEQCGSRRKDRDTRNKMRSDEIAAVSEAIKILTDDEALDTFKKHVPSAALIAQQQQATATFDAFLQRVDERSQVGATKSSAKVLLNVGSWTARKGPSHLDPVGDNANQAAKVVDFMIGNMVHTLHEDDVDDEHKKDFCANETQVMHQLREDKQALSDQLTKTVEGLDGDLEQLTEEIKGLKADINNIDQDVFDTTSQRKKEHMEFMTSYQGMDEAIKLVDKAANRLQEFYSPKASRQTSLLSASMEPTAPPTAAVRRLEAAQKAAFGALVQTHVTNQRSAQRSRNANVLRLLVAPIELPDTPKTYQKKESGGVIGLMNEMKSDMKSDMREAEVEEKHAAGDYKKVMHEAKESRASTVKALKNKKLEKAETEERRQQTAQHNELTIQEVKQLDLYLAQLHAECDFLLRNFENRHEARIEEESGLESAESIVTKEDPPTHNEIEKVYEEEHTDKQVDQHFPDQPMPVE